MKETAVFLNEREQNELARAYGSKTRESLRRSLDLPEQVILPETMEENRELLARTSYVFSTWGMPALTESRSRIICRTSRPCSMQPVRCRALRAPSCTVG